jgi:hypothetical protein
MALVIQCLRYKHHAPSHLTSLEERMGARRLGEREHLRWRRWKPQAEQLARGAAQHVPVESLGRVAAG